MPEADNAVDDPWSMVITAVGAALEDCERGLSDMPDSAGALEFTRFLRAELPGLLEDWQMRREDPPRGAADDHRPIPATLLGHTGAVRDIAFSRDGAMMASADDGGVVRLWDGRTGHGTGALVDRDGVADMSVAFSPDATTLATATTALTLWDPASATVTDTLRTRNLSDRVWSVAYGPTGEFVATGNSHDSVQLWNPRTRRTIRTLTHPGTVFAVALSPDGSALASGANTTVMLWHTSTGRRRHVLSGHAGSIYSLAFSPDNQILASASYDRTIRLWDVRSGNPIATLTGHTSAVMAVAFHTGGTILASGGASVSIPPSGPPYPDDHTVRLWDLHTMRPITTLTGHSGTVSSVAFHPDGTHLASGSFDTTIRLWPINPHPGPS